MKSLSKGQHVLVRGERHPENVALCQVEAIRTPAELRIAPGASSVQAVRSIVKEFGVERLLVLSFEQPDGTTTLLVAFECRDGKVRDLSKQLLTLEPYPLQVH
jgi:hypothetical protein